MTKRTPKQRPNPRAKELEDAFDDGVTEGRRQMQVVVLTYLQERYMNREVVRGSSLGKAILEVAADLSSYIKGLNQAINPAVAEVKAMSDEDIRAEIVSRRAFVKPKATDGQ